jgi:EmrB/QacA subfamily drug resistance transporter
MIQLDLTIVNVALPAIQRDLGVTPANLEWVVNAYSLALATLILAGGALGDRYGRKRMLLAGLAVFTFGSTLCALAPDDLPLIAARAVQGVGGALMTALTLSILVDAFGPERRTSAIGIWAGVAGLGFGLGPVAGGLLIAVAGWSAVFWVSVPIGIVALVATVVGVEESRDPVARALDPLGALLVGSGLCLLTFALVETNKTPWTSPRVVSTLAVAAALLVAFVAWERRAPSPMMPLALVDRRRFACASFAFGAAYCALTSTFFYVTLFWQNMHGWSALRTGLSWIPLNVPYLIASLYAGRLDAVVAPRVVATGGLLLAAAAMTGLAQLDLGSSYARAWPWFALNGLGFGLLAPAVSSVAMGDVPRESAGVGSGVLNSVRQMGMSLGLAVTGSLGVAAAVRVWDDALAGLPAATRHAGTALAQRVAGGEASAVAASLGADVLEPAREAFMAGYRTALSTSAVLLVVAAAVAFIGIRGRTPAAVDATRAVDAAIG